MKNIQFCDVKNIMVATAATKNNVKIYYKAYPIPCILANDTVNPFFIFFI